MHVPRRQKSAKPRCACIPLRSAEFVSVEAVLPHEYALDPECSSHFIHAQHIICPHQRLAVPHACVQVENRTSLLGKLRGLSKKPISCYHGIIADSCNTRHTVLRLII